LKYFLLLLPLAVSLAGADTVMDRIHGALSAGEITSDEAALYMTLSVLDHDALPVRFTEGTVDEPCGTPAMLEAERMLGTLSAPVREEVSRNLARPGLSGPEITIISPQDHFRIHYTTEGVDAVTESYANAVAAAADYSWQVQCEEMNYFRPPPDAGMGGCNRYDMYIKHIDVLGYTTSSGEVKPPDSTHNASASHIVISRNMSDNLLKVTVAHEFQHAVQMAYDYTEPTWFMENCAVFMEEMVYPDVNDYMGYLGGGDNPIRKPWWDIRSGGGSSLYWYGGVTWAFYMWQGYDVGAVRTVWNKCAAVRGPNMMEAIQGMFTDYGTSFTSAFMEYSYWRWFVSDNWYDGGMYFAEAADWSGKPYFFNYHNISTLPASGDQGVYAPETYGIHWIRVNLGSYQGGWVKFSFDGRDGFDWKVGAILWDTDGNSQFSWLSAESPSGVAEVAVPTTGWDYAIFFPAMLSITTLKMNYTFDITYAHGIEEGGAAAAPGIILPANPMTAESRVSFNVSRPGYARLDLYDLSGRLVSTLAQSPMEAGVHTACIQDRPAPGTYFLMLRHPDGAETAKVVISR